MSLNFKGTVIKVSKISFSLFLKKSATLNASTADGYNPYRITNNGIEWEEPDDSDPWASIGYWGDHQIIYLLLQFQ